MFTPLTNSLECDTYLRKIWERGTMQSQERLYAVYLNDKGEREMHKLICKGCYTGTSFDLREVVHYAMANHLDNVVIAHNHPSGECTPSKADIEVTRKIYNTLSSLDIKLIDHIILTHDSYFSFKDAGIIEGYHKDYYGPKSTRLGTLIVGGVISVLSVLQGPIINSY